MDLRITRDELRKTDDGYELMIYLSSDETEFAKELGRDGNNDRVLEEDVRQYVQRKYPNMKVNVARLMLGGLLLTSVPIATTGMAAAAAPNDFAQTSEWAKASVQRLTDQKVITGDEAGNFNPQSTMNRDAFVTMLVRALNLEMVTPETPTFKDVPKTHWAYSYVETAYANGLVKGDTATTFGPVSKVTREQMATIFVRALGLTNDDIKGQGDDLTFADQASIAEYARDSVGFAVKNNLLKGVENNRFAGGAVATREQVAVLADRFLTNHDALVTAAGELKAPTMTAAMERNDLDTIILTFNRAIDGLTAENVTITGPNGEKIPVNSVTLGGDKKTATVETSRLTAGLGYTVTVKTDTVNRTDSVTPESDIVTVADVTPINLKQVSVTFSGKVDAASAETEANYSYGTNVNPQSATLLPDGKTVLLVLGDTVPGNQQERDFTIQNVKDVNGNVIASSTKTVTFLDTSVPRALGVETVGPNLFKVTFNEPVTQVQGSDFLLDNGTYSITLDSVNPVDNSVTLRTGVDLTEAGHTLLINSTRGNTPTTQDYAGFKVPETTLSFDYQKDTVAPAIAGVTALDPTKVTVKFSKPVNVDTVKTTNFYHTYSGYTPANVTASNPVGGFADTFTLDFSNHLLPPGNVTVHTLKGAEGAEIKDAWGNVFAQADATTTVTVTQDVTKPTVASIVSKTDHTVQMTFSKSVVKSDAENAANYVFKDATGNIARFAGLDAEGHPVVPPGSIAYDDTNGVVTFTFDEAIPGGTYKVTAVDIKDKALQANEMDDTTLSFTVNDTTPPTVNNVTLEGANQVVVSFSEPMKTSGPGSILDATNYQFAGGLLPDGTTIKAGTDNKSAIITLPTGTAVTAGGTEFGIGRVADASGNFTRTLGETRTIAAATGATVIAGRVQSTDTRKITVEVNQPLQSITTVGFGWTEGNVVGTSYTNTKVGPNKDIDGAVITLTVDKNIDRENPGSVTITDATGTKNTFGTQIANTATPVAVSDKLAPFVDTSRDGGYVFQSPTRIVLNMSESLNTDTFAPQGTNGFSVSLGTVTRATYDNATKAVVIEGTGFTANTKVSYNGTNGIKDVHDNLLGAFSNQTLKPAPATP